ncbi:GNAT superfamily N-acetyltransferase [Sphingobium sp. B1D7B]|uniref:GNAT family N-acetyltransferase n=1 Tax=unclassified Sphingobium TaxID=2611147 RepID=UPI002225039F|nr:MULTISPECIES: GNAT family N-acetyltransferase [unclassified Sphingobium]MCW2392372.1 GNAT superfamily N-acetyltransferase [Sphingobium sp. B11D3A]MCW2404066.1 GNAT superfamily N-acetyltransferase [Sphingobium sp. B1D7B]
MTSADLVITPVSGKADMAAFIDLAWTIYADDPHWVPPLKSEVRGLLTPGKNPFHEHAEHQYFLARRGGKVVGRISAHIDHLAISMPAEQGMGPGTGNFGMFEAMDEATAHALIETAEGWLRERGMTRVLGPISLSIWEEPGLLVKGFDHSPTVMMGHNRPEYRAWIESAGYAHAKQLDTYELDITQEFPPLIQRIVQSGERNERIRIRHVDKSEFDRDAAIILHILNDAWGRNWGFVPITDHEVAHFGKALKPLVFEDLIRIAELDGEPVAFMMTLPDMNEALARLNGTLFPFGWAKLLWWLRKPKVRTMRVPLMGVVQRLQSSRMASQLAFMMIEYIRRDAITHYGATRGEIGWILDDNQGMKAIAEAIESRINRSYVIYQKAL